jgi:hypothetical protein
MYLLYILTSVICNLESCRLDISGYGGALSLLDTVETELACSLSSILSGKDSLEIGSSVEAILSEESFVSVETGLVKKLSIRGRTRWSITPRDQMPTSLCETLDAVNPVLYPSIDTILCIMLTMPVTSATSVEDICTINNE